MSEACGAKAPLAPTPGVCNVQSSVDFSYPRKSRTREFSSRNQVLAIELRAGASPRSDRARPVIAKRLKG